MANNYFQFKQFTIYQDKCAMKVCTDACMFGAYVADDLQRSSLTKILDIGAGTGLLSLMVAQKNKAAIDAVEINDAAFTQAKENIEQSPWKEKITVFNTDITEFESSKKYDYIISNPPFFEADLQSADENKNTAKHDTTLTLQQLLQHIERLLSEDGFFSVLLPYRRSNYFEVESKKIHFHLAKKILVKQTPKHDYFRVMFIFSRKESVAKTEEIIIKNDEGDYGEEFKRLLKDYYLYL